MSVTVSPRARMAERVAQRRARQELAALGFPFGGTSKERAGWASDALAAGTIERTSQAEHCRRGASLEEIARNTGVSVERVMHHLRRAPDEITSYVNPWQVIPDPDADTGGRIA